MTNQQIIFIPVNSSPAENYKKSPVLIDYTPEYKKEHNINNEIDRYAPNKFVRVPDEDMFESSQIKAFANQNMLKAKMPNPKQAEEYILLIPVTLGAIKDALEKGKEIWDIFNPKTTNNTLMPAIDTEEIYD